MKRVLFVDDDLSILQGLRRVLRRMRDEWDMTFLQSAPEALEIATREPFDAVVTDMHMPRMDGAALLEAIRERSPQTIRILLSGRSGEDRLVRSLVSAHQFVNKPCDPHELELAFQRAFTLRDLLADERLARITSRVGSLPCLPSLYLEVRRALDEEGATIERVGELIAKDIGLTAKVLQMVNSALFGLKRHIVEPSEAVVYLGLETIGATVLAHHLFSSCRSGILSPADLELVWAHSLATGSLARRIVRLEGGDKEAGDQAFLAGLLHEAGVLVLAESLGEEMVAAWQDARRLQLPLQEAEKQRLGASHDLVGAYLFTLWGLPEPVVEAIAFGHEPSACAYPGFSLVAALHAADAIVAEGGAALPHDTRTALDRAGLERLGLTERLPLWRDAWEETRGRAA